MTGKVAIITGDSGASVPALWQATASAAGRSWSTTVDRVRHAGGHSHRRRATLKSRHGRPVIDTAIEHSAGSTPWSTMPACSSPSRSPTTPPKTTSWSRVNLAGFFLADPASHRRHAARGHGHVVNISAMVAERPDSRGAVSPGRPHQGRACLRRQVAGHRVRLPRHPGQRGRARRHPGAAQPPAETYEAAARRGTPSAGWVRSATWSMESSSWSRRPSSPARSCTSTAGRLPATEAPEGPGWPSCPCCASAARSSRIGRTTRASEADPTGASRQIRLVRSWRC